MSMNRNACWKAWGLSAAITLILVAHIVYLGEIPAGLFHDETSLAYNAVLLAESLKDEHGIFLPIYLKCFGSFNSALLTYMMAGIFKAIGPSAFALRLSSFLAFVVLLSGVFFLVRSMLRSWYVALYSLITTGFLPWFFTISRIGFEPVLQAGLVAWSLFLIRRVFESTKTAGITTMMLAGVIVGLSTYSYPTARLLSFLLFGTVAVVYFRRDNLKKAAFFSLGYVLALVPHVWFIFSNPGALTTRFNRLTFLYDKTLSLFEKIELFVQYYFSYFKISFLLLRGDRNLRHATHFGGELYYMVFILFLLGITFFFWRKLWRDRFALLIVANLLFAPVAGSLTHGSPHSLRGILLGLLMVIISCWGMEWIGQVKKYGVWLMSAAIIVLSIESGLYLHDYFGRYAYDWDRNVKAFSNLGMREALQAAVDTKPDRVIVSSKIKYSHTEFYKRVIANPSQIPIKTGLSVPLSRTCIVYHPFEEKGFPKRPPLNSFMNPYWDPLLNKFENRFFEEPFIKVRCYL